MRDKMLMLVAVVFLGTLIEVLLLYVTRKSGPLPFKLKINPDFDLPSVIT